MGLGAKLNPFKILYDVFDGPEVKLTSFDRKLDYLPDHTRQVLGTNPALFYPLYESEARADLAAYRLWPHFSPSPAYLHPRLDPERSKNPQFPKPYKARQNSDGLFSPRLKLDGRVAMIVFDHKQEMAGVVFPPGQYNRAIREPVLTDLTGTPVQRAGHNAVNPWATRSFKSVLDRQVPSADGRELVATKLPLTIFPALGSSVLIALPKIGENADRLDLYQAAKHLSIQNVSAVVVGTRGQSTEGKALQVEKELRLLLQTVINDRTGSRLISAADKDTPRQTSLLLDVSNLEGLRAISAHELNSLGVKKIVLVGALCSRSEASSLHNFYRGLADFEGEIEMYLNLKPQSAADHSHINRLELMSQLVLRGEHGARSTKGDRIEIEGDSQRSRMDIPIWFLGETVDPHFPLQAARDFLVRIAKLNNR